jgi:hypothetical protein
MHEIGGESRAYGSKEMFIQTVIRKPEEYKAIG